MYFIYNILTIISASAPRGGATRTLLITLNFIDLTNCNNCVYGFYSKFGWFINDCKTHGFLMNFTRMESKSESPCICLRTKIPARNYISTEMNPLSEYSGNYLICRTWVFVKKIQQQKHFCSVNDRLKSSSQFQICSVSVNFQVRFKHPLLYPNASRTYTVYTTYSSSGVIKRYGANYLILLQFHTRNILFLIVYNCLYTLTLYCIIVILMILFLYLIFCL